MTKTAYTLEGPAGAPVLMFSNSLGTTHAMWEQQAAVLRQHYRILRYDTRGHGGSAAVGRDDHDNRDDNGFTLEQLGRDVLQLLDTLQLERVNFCGISMGGLIGLWLGVHASHRLQRLVVANSAACIGSSDGWRSRAALVLSDGMQGVADGAAGRWFTSGFISSQGATVQQMVNDLRQCPPDGYANCCLALAQADLRAQISSIEAPTLLIAGRHDPVTTTADARFMQERISGAILRELDASHLSNVEAGDAFNACLQEFLH